jgi:hypothetical protein
MPKNVDKYTKERKDVLNNLFQILGINENNNTFLLHELDTNIEKQNKILELEYHIKKYFICGSWNCFKDCEVKRKYLSLIKNTMKNMGYIVMSARRNVKIDDKFVNTNVYFVTQQNI